MSTSPEAPPECNQPDSSPELPIPPAKKTSILPGATLAVALAALAVGGYSLVHEQQLQQQLKLKNTEYSSQIAEFKKYQIQSQNEFTAHTQSMQQTQTELKQKIIQLNTQLNTVLNQNLYQSQDWLMLKARYYLELAQINSHWTTHFSVSAALLKQADDLLKQLHQEPIFAVRQALAMEINELNSVPIVDIAGLLSQLDAVQLSVDKLSIQSSIEPLKSLTEEEKSKTGAVSPWRARLQSSFNLLEKMVVIRRDNDDIQPLMSPVFESMLRESIRFNLETAQWAILNNNPTVYQFALKQALLNIKRVFKQDNPSIKTLLAQLATLQEVALNQTKPKPGNALTLLNEIITQKDLIKPASGNEGDNKP